MEGRSSQRMTALEFLKSRWIMAVVSFYVLFASGATYIFGIYSGAIKESLHYNQSTIDTLSFFKDLGANVGIIAGLLNEVVPSWVVLAVGAVMNLFGYLMIWLAVMHRIAPPPAWHMYLFLCIGANSQTFANTGALVTFVKSFPKGRGEVLGIVKGCVGLSGAIFTQIYLAIYGEDARGVILLIGWLPSLVTLMFMFLVRPMTPVYDKNETRTLYKFLYLALLLAGFLMFAIILENEVHLHAWAYKTFGAITLIMVTSNIFIGIRAEYAFRAQVEERAVVKTKKLQELSSTAATKELQNGKDEEKRAPSENDKLSSSNVVPTYPHEHHDAKPKEGGSLASNTGSWVPTPLPSKAAHLPAVSKKPNFFTKLMKFFRNLPERGEDFNIPQALVSIDMWVLFISITCGVGATLTAIDNMGQIGESLGYEKKSINTFVSLISIWNFLGRVMAGFISEILLRRYRFPRTLMLTIVLAMACIGHLLIAFPAPNTLYIASIMVGVCFGAQWPLLYAIVSELFGLKYYATLYNVGALASPLGSYLLNVMVAGHLYDREALRQHEALLLFKDIGAVGVPAPSAMTGDLKCMGAACFKLTFLIMTMVSAFGSLVSAILVLRTKKFYSQDIYSKFHVNSDNEESQQEVGH